MSAEKPTRLKQPSILRWVSPGADGAQLLVEPTPPKWLHVNKRKAELLEKPAEDKPTKTSHNGGRPSGNESRGVADGAERSNRVPKGGLRLKLERTAAEKLDIAKAIEAESINTGACKGVFWGEDLL